MLAMTQFRRTTVVACWDEEEDGRLGSDAYATRASSSGAHLVATFVFEMIGYATFDTLDPAFGTKVVQATVGAAVSLLGLR